MNLYLKDERKAQRYKWFLPVSFNARSRGLNLSFVELVEDYQHQTPKKQVARQQLKKQYLAMLRSYQIVEGMNGFPTQQSRKASGSSKGNHPDGAAGGSKDGGAERNTSDSAALAKKGFVADAKAAGLGSEGIDDGLGLPSDKFAKENSEGARAHVGK